MIDVHFLEFALSGKLSPEQIKDVISAVKLKEEIKKLHDDCCAVYNDKTTTKKRKNELMQIATAIQSRIEEAEK